MIKRISAVFVLCCMLLSVSAGAYEFSYDVLCSTEAIPGELKQNSDSPVYRDEFAAIAAGIAGIKVSGTQNTVFSDVTEENQYSAAVQAVYDAGFMSGIGSGMFGAETPITGQQALAVFIRITGYDVIADYYGGWPDGYTRISQKLGLVKAFSNPVTEPLKYSDLWKLCDLVMETPVASTEYTDNNGEIGQNFYVNDDAPSYMNERMNIPTKLSCIRLADIPDMAKLADKEANPIYPVPTLWDAKELEAIYRLFYDESEKSM